MSRRVLILALGNPLRSDDGLAWHAARLFSEKHPTAEAEIVCVHQLTPELAEPASLARCVVFLDARRDGEPGEVRCSRTAEKTEAAAFSHALTPSRLMALCESLYGFAPEAYELSATGECFALGDKLSACAIGALPRLAEAVVELIGELRNRELKHSVPCR